MSQRPASSPGGLSPASGTGQLAGGGGGGGGQGELHGQEITPISALEESVKNRSLIRHGLSHSMVSQGLGQLRARELAQVCSVSPGLISRSDG